MELADFKSVKSHAGYFIRDLGDNKAGGGQWVEIVREDGWGFGAMPIDQVEGVVKADEASPAPPTGRTLQAVFSDPAAQPTEENEGP